MNYRDAFARKNITVMGLGVLGRGVGDAEFLAECGAHVLVTDLKSTDALKESVRRLAKYKNVSFVLGEHREKDFKNADMVLKAAGVPLDSPYIAIAQAHHTPVVMSSALFTILTKAYVVGVTGTRGKSTVTHMIHHGLAQMGRPAFLGGNVRGISTLAMLPETKKGDYAVLELDSWQLQGFGDLKISPHLAIFTNFMPDHLNYYSDTTSYFNDKANIFRFQKSGGHLLASQTVVDRIRTQRPPVWPRVPEPIPDEWQLKIRGAHNRENAALAAEALRVLGLSEESVRGTLETFAGIPGRLEFVRELNGVSIYNDSNATTPDATIAGLRAFPEGRIILIAGGADKSIPVQGLCSEIMTRTKRLILVEGTGTHRLSEEFAGAPVHNSIERALADALGHAKSGDTILFSPAFASFGMFKNEYDRSDQFTAEVRAL